MPIWANRSRVRRLVREGDLREAIIPTAGEIERELVPRLDQAFRAHERELFATQGASGGAVWTPLSDNPPGQGYKSWKDRLFARATAYRKAIHRARGGKRPAPLVNKILQLYGDLMVSLTRVGGEHVARFVRIGEGNGIVELGSMNPVASYHWAGTDRMPVRDPIQHTAEQNAAYGAVVWKWMQPRFKRMISALRAKAMVQTGRA